MTEGLEQTNANFQPQEVNVHSSEGEMDNRFLSPEEKKGTFNPDERPRDIWEETSETGKLEPREKKEIWEETGRFSLPEQGSNKHLDDDFWSGNQKNDSLQESNIKQAQNIPEQKIDSATPSLEKAKDNASSEANDMQKSDVNENKATGGTYGELKSEWKGELEKEPPHEVHHMPANDVNGLDLNDGPAIVMDKADHRQTASCGNSVEAREYREKQKELIENGKFEEAMQMDIDDIHDKFGNKYDEAIAQMKQKAKEKGLI